MLKRVFPIVLICTFVFATVSYSCGYGFSGRNGRLYVYINQDHAELFDGQDGAPVSPLVLSSQEDSAIYFDDFMLDTINRRIDWEKQVILVFAWTGAMDDRLRVQDNPHDGLDRLFLHQPGKRGEVRQHVEVYRFDRDKNWMLLSVPAQADHVVDAQLCDPGDA